MIDLTTEAKRVFPSAIVCILAIPPRSNPKLNKHIRSINKELRKSLPTGVLFKECSSLWYHHVGENGDVDSGILTTDGVHLSDWGLSLLLMNVTSFFFKFRQPPAAAGKSDDLQQCHAYNNSNLHKTKSLVHEKEERIDTVTDREYSSSSKVQDNDSSIPALISKAKDTCLNLWRKYKKA